jgi:hypothetical protein
VLALAFAASLAAQPAAPAPPQADWRALGTHQNGTAFAYDSASIRRDPATALARVTLRATLSSGRYAVSEIEIRCAANETRVTSTQNYAADGTRGRRDDVPVAFETIPSGSFVEVIRNDACAAR